MQRQQKETISRRLTAAMIRSISEIQEEAKEITFTEEERIRLRWAAGLSVRKMEDTVGFLAKQRSQAWVYAAWEFIRQCHIVLSPKQRGDNSRRGYRYRRRNDWTIPDQQAAIAMARSHEYSIQEIARALGRSEKAVRRKLARCSIRCVVDDGYSARELAEVLHIHRGVIQRWKSLGLVGTGSGRHYIRCEDLQDFFARNAGLKEAEQLDIFSYRKLVGVLGSDPLKDRYEQALKKAQDQNEADAKRKREKRARQHTEAADQDDSNKQVAATG